MSAIRPDLPSIASGISAARPQGLGHAADVRAAFFRAALEQVQATPPAIVETPVRRTEAPRAEPETGRSMRPGSLLDIRV